MSYDNVYMTRLFEEFGHSPVTDEDTGEIDMFAVSWEFCNGPMCRYCHESFCEWCSPEGTPAFRRMCMGIR